MEIAIVIAIIAVAAIYTLNRLRKPSCGCAGCHCGQGDGKGSCCSNHSANILQNKK